MPAHAGTVPAHGTHNLLLFQIDIVHNIFIQNLDNPPLCKSQPPVAGAVHWERSLFFRIKHTILRFQEVQEILDSERGAEVRSLAGAVPCQVSQATRRCRRGGRLTFRSVPAS